MQFLSYSPRSERARIVVPSPPASNGNMLTRAFNEAAWSRSLTRPHPSDIRRWVQIMEPEWVARCIYDEMPHSCRRAAEANMPPPLADNSKVREMLSRLNETRGGEVLWNVALMSKIAGMPYSALALETAIALAAEDAPELGTWSNYVALLGDCSTANAEPNAIAKAIKSIAKIFAGQPQAERIILDIQTQLDASEITQQAIRDAGLGRYHWKWTVPGSEELTLLFPRPFAATEWLCGASLQPQASVRAALSQLRSKVRSAQVVLVDDQTDMVSPVPLIEMIDKITLGEHQSDSLR